VDLRTKLSRGKGFDPRAQWPHSAAPIGGVANRLNTSRASNDEAPPTDVRSVYPNIFSHVCSDIAGHPGTHDSRNLAEFGDRDTAEIPNSESQLVAPRLRRPLRRRARTTLFYLYEQARFDGLNYLVGAAAAITVVGSFMLAIAFDEGIFEQRSLRLTLPLSESQELHEQAQAPVPPEFDQPPVQLFQGAPNPASLQAENENVAESAPEQTPAVAELESVTAADVPPLLPEEKPALESTAAIEDNSLASSLNFEGTAAAASSFQEDMQLKPAEPPVNAAPLSKAQQRKPAQKKIDPARSQRVAESKASALQNKVQVMPRRRTESPPGSTPRVKNEPPKPLQTAAQEKVKSDELTKKPSVAESITPPANAPTVESGEAISGSPQAETIEQPPAQTIAENPERPLPAAAVQPTTTATRLHEPGPASVAQSNSQPVPEAKPVQKRETLLEDWLGFNPRDVIVKFQLGRRTDQPGFIRQLENVEGRAED
jgi:hypothetical protein